MSLATTTLAAAVALTDRTIKVASATSIAPGRIIICDGEQMQVTQDYVSGVTVGVLRGRGGTQQVAHVSGANVTHGLASDFANAAAPQDVSWPLHGRSRPTVSYSASGAITLPVPGQDLFVILNGTSVLAMTVAAPDKSLDGCAMYIAGNGAAAHTVTFTGGLSGASTNYDVITVNATAPVVLGPFFAVNGLWQAGVAVPMAGTVTNITATVA